MAEQIKPLILGALGFIGNSIAKEAVRRGIPTGILSKSYFDYSHEQNFRNFLQNTDYNIVINCSGYTGIPNVDACEDHKEECLLYNVTVPLMLTRVCNELKIPIIHIGSGCIYTGDSSYAFKEEDLANFGLGCRNSSFYSKTKDSFEMMIKVENLKSHIFRIRIPFNDQYQSKNYLYKLYNYDNLISMDNSITSVEDLVDFTLKFIQMKFDHPECDYDGVYNVVNEGYINAKEITEMMKKRGLINPNWKFLDVSEMNFKTGRSNCVLDTSKIKSIGLGLPDVREKMEQVIMQFDRNIKI